MEYESGHEGVNASNADVSFGYRDPETVNKELVRLSRWKKFLFWWRLQVSVGMRQPEGFSGPVEFFLFLCKKCGPILTYPQGYEGWIDCEECRLKSVRKFQMAK